MITTKQLLQTFFTFVIVTVCVLGIGFIGYGVIHPDEKPFDAKEYAKTNHCPYEGLECPNANDIFIKDSIAYSNAEYVIDSLVNRTQLLETQLAGYELQNHSQLSTYIKGVNRFGKKKQHYYGEKD